jgi:ubiquinone/menaquinone biosynthesis C-methylase UbiE
VPSGDLFRFINDLDEATHRAFVDRMEFRGRDATFSRMRDAYLDRIPLPAGARVLEIGCGSGVVSRALARRHLASATDAPIQIVAVDQSPVMIDAGRRFAADEGVAQSIEFRLGDAHSLDLPDDHCDAVIGHTLISHVADPLGVLREAARVVKPGGKIAIFDGDYASLTFAYPDPVLAKQIEESLIETFMNNPRVMRDLPRLLNQAGLQVAEVMPHIFAEVGTGTFFPGFVASFGPVIARNGIVSPDLAEDWITAQRRAAEDGTFFASCNYYAYLATRPPR